MGKSANVHHLVDILGIHLESTTGAPVVLLREHDAPYRYLPVFVGDAEAAAIAFAVAGEAPARPLTHDVMAQLLDRLGAHVDAVEITELRDGTFFARLSVTGPTGHHDLDTRPSDALAIAVRFATPVYVDDGVLDEAGTLPQADPDDDGTDFDEADAVYEVTAIGIDHQVEQFRTELDRLGPAAFDASGAGNDDDLGPPPDR